jgi:hypothetical protein
MSSPPSPYAGLPASPRATRQALSPIDTSFSTHSTLQEQSMTPYSDKTARSRSSLIFANATIPLSPSSTASSPRENPYEGLAPRKRSGLARLFCCFGREERARRRVVRDTEYEKVGVAGHWSEY